MFQRKGQPSYRRLTQKEKKVRAYTGLVDLLDTTVWIQVELDEQLRSVGLTLTVFAWLNCFTTNVPGASRRLSRCDNAAIGTCVSFSIARWGGVGCGENVTR
jgi:hypothetical protein